MSAPHDEKREDTREPRKPKRQQQRRKKRIIRVDAESDLIRTAESKPRPLPPELKARYKAQFGSGRAGGNRRSTAAQLRAKGIPSQFWPPLDPKTGEPIVLGGGRKAKKR